MQAQELKKMQTIAHGGKLHMVGKVQVMGAGRYATAAISTYTLDGGRMVLGAPSIFLAATTDVPVVNPC